MPSFHYFSSLLPQSHVLISTGLIVGILSLQASPAFSRKIGNVTIPNRKIELPRDNQIYFLPVLVESNYADVNLKKTSGSLLMTARMGTRNHDNLASWAVSIPITASTKSKDNWKKLMFFRFGCTPEGKVFGHNNKSKLFNKVEAWIRFDHDAAAPWAGMDITCSKVSTLPASEAEYLIPLSSLERLNLSEYEKIANGFFPQVDVTQQKEMLTANYITSNKLSVEQAKDYIVAQKYAQEEQVLTILFITSFTPEEKQRLKTLLNIPQ